MTILLKGKAQKHIDVGLMLQRNKLQWVSVIYYCYNILISEIAEVMAQQALQMYGQILKIILILIRKSDHYLSSPQV